MTKLRHLKKVQRLALAMARLEGGMAMDDGVFGRCSDVCYEKSWHIC